MKMKKLAAIALAGTMVLSSAAVAFAEPAKTGTSGGAGSVEGVVTEDVYNAVLPTESTTAYQYIVDPQELIRQTDAAKYSGATFGEGTVFFKNSDKAYSNTSNAEKIINKSSKPLDVTVAAKATVTTDDTEGATNAALATGKTFSEGNTALEVYLGITDSVDGNAEKALTAAGAEMKAVLGAAPEGAYEYQYDETKGYSYGLVADADKFKFAEYSFQINGAANAAAEWKADTGVPAVSVTWTVDLAAAGATVTVPTPEQTQTPATVACNLQTVASGVGTDITSTLALDKGVYIRINGSLSTVNSADLTDVKINGTTVTPAITGNSSGNNGAVYFKFPDGTALKAGDVINVVLDGTTYSFTLAS